MNLSSLTDAQLVDLLAKASAELQSRMSKTEVQRIPAPTRMEVVREPPHDEKDAVLRIAAELRAGHYIRAADREQVEAVAREYPEWVRRQRVPTTSAAGAWEKARQTQSAPRARER